MKKRIMIFSVLLLLAFAAFSLTACGVFQIPGVTNTSSGDDQIRAVYTAYAESGGTLSYDEWLASIKGAKGEKGDDGAAGVGIASIAKTGTAGLIDTYTITLTNGETSTFEIKNGAKGDDGQAGAGIASIEKTGTEGLVDIYTITLTNGETSTFTVTNGRDGTSQGGGASVDPNSSTPEMEENGDTESNFNSMKAPYANSFTEQELALIDNAMQSNASEDVIKEAVAMIYERANANMIQCDQALAVLRGKRNAEIAVGSGGMIVRGIKVQAGSEFYYQKAAMVNESSIKSSLVLKGLKASLNQQERAYTNGDDDFRLTGTLKGDDAKIWDEEEYETVPYILPEVPDTMTSYSEDDFKTKGYYLEDPREITNFKIEAQYIVLKDLPEGQNYIEEAEDDVGNKYYICRFSLAYLEDDCVRIARQYLRDSAQKDAKEQNLQYGKFDITMEVWENGYLKRMYDEEEWEGSVDGFTTTSTSDYESVIYYDYDERIFSKEDQTLYEDDDEGANWAYNIVARYKAEIDEIG